MSADESTRANRPPVVTGLAGGDCRLRVEAHPQAPQAERSDPWDPSNRLEPVLEQRLCPEILSRLHPGFGIARNRVESAVLTPNDSGSYLEAPSQARAARIDVEME